MVLYFMVFESGCDYAEITSKICVSGPDQYVHCSRVRNDKSHEEVCKQTIPQTVCLETVGVSCPLGTHLHFPYRLRCHL